MFVTRICFFRNRFMNFEQLLPLLLTNICSIQLHVFHFILFVTNLFNHFWCWTNVPMCKYATSLHQISVETVNMERINIITICQLWLFKLQCFTNIENIFNYVQIVALQKNKTTSNFKTLYLRATIFILKAVFHNNKTVFDQITKNTGVKNECCTLLIHWQREKIDKIIPITDLFIFD